METILKATSMQLYILMYFVYKQKCSPLKNRIKKIDYSTLCDQGPHLWVTRQQSTVSLIAPPLLNLLPARNSELAEEWVVKTMLKSLGNSCFEEMFRCFFFFFAFFKHWNQSKVLMMVNKSKITKLSCSTLKMHKYVISLIPPIYILYLHGQIKFT